MTRQEQLSCLTDRPCAVCKHHTDNGCYKWKCVFEEQPEIEQPCGDAIKELKELEYYNRPFDNSETEDKKAKALFMAIQALEQEQKYCDRNICIKNEYNGIGCDECEVTKSQEPQESEV